MSGFGICSVVHVWENNVESVEYSRLQYFWTEFYTRHAFRSALEHDVYAYLSMNIEFSEALENVSHAI